MSRGRATVAVVGSGVSGLSAAYLLQRAFDVTLYEADARPGGHAHTHDVATADGRRLRLDSGFIVHNRRTYPLLGRLFAELGIRMRPSDMSFSVRCDACGLEYAGARGARGVFPRAANARSRAFLRLLLYVKRFHRQARRLLADPGADSVTLGAFLAQGRYSQGFVRHFMTPFVSAVWSCAPGDVASFPARYLFAFFANHGMLSVWGAPRWRTVVGGSRTYVEAIARRLAEVRLATPVVEVERDGRGAVVRDGEGGERHFDRVCLATHADTALRLLADPSPDERRLLAAFRYSRNETVLHTDGSLLPRARAARASWNYLLDECASPAAAVHATYDLNRLQGVREPLSYCVTLNATARIRPGAELARMTYEHPLLTLEARAAQRELPRLNAVRRTAYAGAYHGFGFHEDGCAAGVRAAAALGVAW